MKMAFAVVAIAAVGLGSYKAYSSYTAANMSEEDLLMQENVDALSSDENGAKCPKGCRDIGWGVDKILECDCNYDHVSCCKSWGC